jgi:hypothetical protein
VFADAAAPGIVLAQAVGRLGNWFNNELYGSPTTLPWGLTIHEWDSAAGRAVLGADGRPVVLGTFHPTFLYELLWNVGIAAVLLWLDRRHRLGHGRLFAVYVLLYTVGRFWIEALRVDPANQILGLRLNLWTSVLVGLGALVYLVVSARLRPGREESVLRPSAVPAPPVPVAERLGGGRPEAHEGDEGDEPGGADGTGTEADAGGPGDGAADGAAGGEKVAGRRGDPPGAEVPRP